MTTARIILATITGATAASTAIAWAAYRLAVQGLTWLV